MCIFHIEALFNSISYLYAGEKLFMSNKLISGSYLRYFALEGFICFAENVA